MEFFGALYFGYSHYVAATLLNVVVPYLILSVMVQRHIVKRDGKLDGSTGSSDDKGNATKPGTSHGRDSEDDVWGNGKVNDSIVGRFNPFNVGNVPKDPPSGLGNYLVWRFKRWWLKALAWLGLEEGEPGQEPW